MVAELCACLLQKGTDHGKRGVSGFGLRGQAVWRDQITFGNGLASESLGRDLTFCCNRRQPLYPRSTRKTHQEGFGHVVLSVGEKHVLDPAAPPVY